MTEQRHASARVPHPDVERVTAQFAEQGVPTYDQIGVLKARAILENVTRIQKPSVRVARVSDILVPGPAGRLPVRIYHPQPSRRLPLVVYLHGGGWCLGGVRVGDRPCRRLAVQAQCVVASVEFRRAPETRFPGPLEDCVAAISWLAAHDDEIEADARRLTMMGDSAGGNLAAAAALVCRDQGSPEITQQVLLYPCLWPARSDRFSSMREQADGPLMTRRELEWFWELYLRGEDDEGDPRAVPLCAEHLSGLAKALIILAELDPLRDEGLAYADRLREAGNEVECIVFPGAAHGFWWMDAEMSQADELTRLLAARLGAPA